VAKAGLGPGRGGAWSRSRQGGTGCVHAEKGLVLRGSLHTGPDPVVSAEYP